MTDIKPELIEKAAKALADDWNPDRDPVLSAMFLDYAHTALVAAADDLRAEGAAAALRDEYHTLDELYEYRMLYNALAANAMPDRAVKSWRHSDGEECFGGGWFVVYLTLPSGQVSNHYKAEHWDLFQVPESDLAPAWDGHTPAEAARRLYEAVRADQVAGARADARVALEAAADDIAAQALREAAEAFWGNQMIREGDVKEWLRGRADRIEARDE